MCQLHKSILITLCLDLQIKSIQKNLKDVIYEERVWNEHGRRNDMLFLGTTNQTMQWRYFYFTRNLMKKFDLESLQDCKNTNINFNKIIKAWDQYNSGGAHSTPKHDR